MSTAATGAGKAAHALLPDAIDDFRSPAFWARFFEERGNKAFEWYGNWSNFRDNFVAAVAASPRFSAASGRAPTSASILVLGCGNSEMSAQLYADGWKNIMNVDFDEGVIEKMREKHKGKPEMRWEVMDVTNMKGFSDGTYDVVLDKGTLDAMMTNDSTEVRAFVGKMFAEVRRVLRPDGFSLTVTLGQDHLLAFYLNSVSRSGCGWGNVTVETFAQPDFSSNALQFVLVASAVSPAAAGASSGGDECATIRLPSTFDVVDTHPASGGSKRKDKPARAAKVALPVETTAVPIPRTGDAASLVAFQRRVMELVHEAQWSYGTHQQLASVHPDNYVTLDIWVSQNPVGPPSVLVAPAGSTPTQIPTPIPTLNHTHARDDVKSDAAEPEIARAPRFTITVVDVSLAPSAAVILVPHGREHEWSFHSREGQTQIAKSTLKYGRVMFVCMNRGHTFGTQAAVQAELSPIITRLLPPELRGAASTVPFMAVSDDIGAREHVASGASTASGLYVVEDVTLPKDEWEDVSACMSDEMKATGGHTLYSRRLVFLSNRNAIQSECIVVKGKDASHTAFVPACLRLEYQQAIASVVAQYWSGVTGAATHTPPTRRSCLVIGLGGGSLPGFLAHAFPSLDVTCVELDAQVVQLASSHFGLLLDGPPTLLAECTPPHAIMKRTTVSTVTDVASATASPSEHTSATHNSAGYVHAVIGDGLAAVAAIRAGLSASDSSEEGRARQIDILIVDVDSKDLKAGISFPPLPFVSKGFLEAARDILAPGGRIIYNFACRSKPLAGGITGALQRCFGNVATLSLEDAGDINSLLIAVKEGTPETALELTAAAPATSAAPTSSTHHAGATASISSVPPPEFQLALANCVESWAPKLLPVT